MYGIYGTHIVNLTAIAGNGGNMFLRDDQLRVLRHMLGVDNQRDKKDPVSYRNYYCTSPGNPLMNGLRHLGFVEMYRKDENYEWFTATETGIAAGMDSARQRRYSKARRRYLCYLHISDCYSNLTFKQFLTDPEFAETRANI